VLAAVAVGAGLAAAWAMAATRAHETSAVFRNQFVTFRYPTSWSTTVRREKVLHFDPMVYLGTEQARRDPCKTSKTPLGTTTVCGWPVSRLSPNGVLVKWENRGFPGVNLGRFPGKTTLIGGRAARVSVQRPGTCGQIGADETISIAVSRPLQSNWTQIDACLRGPKLAPLERQVQALLGSTKFLAP
jgi:hypothetical protein